jgi:sigma-B regulation protein RsbU (phosphoserine phosphatase)
MRPVTESHASRFLFWFRRLTRKEKFFLVFCVLEGMSQISLRLFNFPLPFSSWVDLLFIILALVIGLIYLRRYVHRLLWRLRNRLIITYILIGVVPIGLILAMLAISTYLLLGQVATYLVTTELRRHNDLLHDIAYSLGRDVSDHVKTGSGESAAFNYLEDIQNRLPNFQAVVQTSHNTFAVPADATLNQLPGWSRPGFQGLLFSGREFALAAHVQFGEGTRRVEVFAYEPADEELLSGLLPGITRIQFRNIGAPNMPVHLNGKEPAVSFRPRQSVRSAAGEIYKRRLPGAQGWWDFTVSWGTPIEVFFWGGLKQTKSIIVGVESRPSLIIRQLFSSLGELAETLNLVLLLIAAMFLVVEIASLVFGISLIRSITRSVADLYHATLRVKAADFSYRIPIRSTDQLSELGSSFNIMTEDIRRLIVESKEKERLESELEIAREVQAQLFPKTMPTLKTLELRGICNPARMVSGDYFDFVAIDSLRTAIVVGDIAGKGISAALLMASIQSSLRAQLSLRSGQSSESPAGLGMSTAELVSTLNCQLYANTTAEKFASFFCGVYDEARGRLSYTNAGHLPPILIRDGQATCLSVTGMVIGAFPDVPYEELCLQLHPGDLLVAYTDGITEAENEYGEEFGAERLTDLLLLNAYRPLDELIILVTTAVNEWQSSPEPADDMTVLLARRL